MSLYWIIVDVEVRSGLVSHHGVHGVTMPLPSNTRTNILVTIITPWCGSGYTATLRGAGALLSYQLSYQYRALRTGYFTFAKKWRHTCILILCRWLLIIIILSLFGKMVTILKIKLKPIDSFCLRLIDFYYLWFIMAWQFKIYYCPSRGNLREPLLEALLLQVYWTDLNILYLLLLWGRRGKLFSPVLCVSRSRYQTM